MNEHAEHPAGEWFTKGQTPCSGRVRGGPQGLETPVESLSVKP